MSRHATLLTYIKKYRITEPELILLENELSEIAKMFEWRQSITHTVMKELIWDCSKGKFSTYNRDRFACFQRALKVVREGKWTSPKPFAKEYEAEGEAAEMVSKMEKNHPINPKILTEMQKVFTRTTEEKIH